GAGSGVVSKSRLRSYSLSFRAMPGVSRQARTRPGRKTGPRKPPLRTCAGRGKGEGSLASGVPVRRRPKRARAVGAASSPHFAAIEPGASAPRGRGRNMVVGDLHWTEISEGWPVIGRGGRPLGRIVQVMGDREQDAFRGVTVN